MSCVGPDPETLADLVLEERGLHGDLRVCVPEEPHKDRLREDLVENLQGDVGERSSADAEGVVGVALEGEKLRNRGERDDELHGLELGAVLIETGASPALDVGAGADDVELGSASKALDFSAPAPLEEYPRGQAE
jgi:hypothetical protein